MPRVNLYTKEGFKEILIQSAIEKDMSIAEYVEYLYYLVNNPPAKR